MDENKDPNCINKLLCDILVDLTKQGLYDEVRFEILDQDNEIILKEIFWDLVPILCTFLDDEVERSHPGVLPCCECILEKISELVNPKELLIILMEHIERFACHNKFTILLKITENCLKRMEFKIPSLNLILDSYYLYFKKFDPPSDHYYLEDKEKVLQDLDDNVYSITSGLTVYLEFFNPHLSNFNSLNLNAKQKKHGKALQKAVIQNFLLLLEHPIVYLEIVNDAKSNFQNDSFILCQQFVDILSIMQPDVIYSLSVAIKSYKFKNLAKIKNKKLHKVEEYSGDVLSSNDEPISFSEMGFSMWFYLIFVEKMSIDKLPQVYSADYVLRTLEMVIRKMLEHSHSVVCIKGILLLQSLIDRIIPSTLNFYYLEIVSDVIKVLNKIIVFNSSKEIRKKALNVLPMIIKVFNIEGRYNLFCYLMKTIDHSGLAGYVIGLVKDEINEAFSTRNECSFFLGANVQKLLFLICDLPKKETTDLLEHSDKIISSLNLLRFVLIRDYSTENKTKIWNVINEMEKGYLEEIKVGLNMSKSHYKLELEQSKKSKDSRNKKDIDVSLSVGSENMPSMDLKQKSLVIQKALCTFDLIESILMRINELIREKKGNVES